MASDPLHLLRRLFAAAVAAADPAHAIPPHLPPPPKGRTVVLGAGKAAAAMAQAVEAHWPGPLSGLVVVPEGHATPTRWVEVALAAHPVPDARGAAAARRLLARAQSLSSDDLALCLISGGGSALTGLPGGTITLEEKRAVTTALLRSGAAIGEINTVRKHLSAFKGGRLAVACFPAPCVTLIISDVPGDDPATIASGPTVADPTTAADAVAVLARHGIAVRDAVARHLATPAAATPKPGDPRLARSRVTLVATPQGALEAAAAVAVRAGYVPLILGDAIEGEAREVARVHAGITRQVLRHSQPVAAPCVLLSGGETTVTVRGPGRGGRNTEFLLALAIALGGAPGVHALAADSDGIDGAGAAAGAVIAPDTLARARAAGLDARAHLDGNDSHSFFAALGDLVLTGPTRTNVNDFRAVVIERPSEDSRRAGEA
ncbi:MAG: glycerate kinase [Alphaproteobacteria bacterium]|nr:glycerate kinase [Alphaproteobacteria bacterium]